MKIKGFLLFVLTCFSVSSALADHPKPIISRVPLYRLVINLENSKEQDPKDPHIYYALGRLYSMAYAKKKDSVDAIIRKGEGEYVPYYGFDPNLPHFFAVKETKDTSRNGFARECLDRAIQNFKNSLHLDTTYVPALLGLAWCTDQKGNKTEAIVRYREILGITTKREGNIASLETAETAGYLIKLLDKENDKEEVAQLEARVKSFKPGYMISPVLIPLGDYRFEDLTDTGARVKFDLDGTGSAKEWEWLSEKAGWLVYMKNSEKVENAMQLFGNRTFNIFWENGYKAMASLDDNKNGQLEGKELQNLAVWNDKNKNGISEDGEIITIESLDIRSLSYNYSKISGSLLKSDKGILFKDGSARPSYDWFPKCVSGSL